MAALSNLPSPIRPVVTGGDVSMSPNPPGQPVNIPTEKHMVHWFRKGLRMHDNPSLREGLKGCATFRCVFILDPWFAGSSNIGINKWRFLLQCLEDLDLNLRKLNSRLFVIRGQPADILPKLFKEWKTTCLTFEGDPEPFGKVRDQNIITLCKELSIEVVSRVSHTLYDLDLIIEKNGGKTPLTYHQFQSIVAKLDYPSPAEAMVTPLLVRGATTPVQDDHDEKYGVPTLEELGFDIEGLQPPTWKGGETEALRRLERHLERKAWVASFGRPKMTPQSLLASPTGLSPFLRFGCLSTRLFYHDLNKLYKRIKKAPPPLSLHGQLLWREFFYCAATRNPNFDRMLANPICVQIPWDTNIEALAKWANAQTGFPWIDAIMTQLREEGWIHHLARHAVACFLTRGDLWLSWEEGMKIFDELLLDADWSVNAGMWMWLSCSSFFQQFFHCYCPVKFGRKADSNGDFIRRYLPILKNVPTRYIHEPWMAPHSVQKASKCVIGLDYPLPMVNHPVVSKINIERIKQVYRQLANYRGSRVNKCVRPKSPEAMIIEGYNNSQASPPPPSPMTPQTPVTQGNISPALVSRTDAMISTDVIQYPPCCHGDQSYSGLGSLKETSPAIRCKTTPSSGKLPQGNPMDSPVTDSIRGNLRPSGESMQQAGGNPMSVAAESMPVGGKPMSVVGKPMPVGGKPLNVGVKPMPVNCKPLPVSGKPMPVSCKPLPVSGKPMPVGKVMSGKPFHSRKPMYSSPPRPPMLVSAGKPAQRDSPMSVRAMNTSRLSGKPCTNQSLDNALEDSATRQESKGKSIQQQPSQQMKQQPSQQMKHPATMDDQISGDYPKFPESSMDQHMDSKLSEHSESSTDQNMDSKLGQFSESSMDQHMDSKFSDYSESSTDQNMDSKLGQFSESSMDQRMDSKFSDYSESSYKSQMSESASMEDQLGEGYAKLPQFSDSNQYAGANPNADSCNAICYSMGESEEAMLNEESNVIDIADSIISESEERQKQ